MLICGRISKPFCIHLRIIHLRSLTLICGLVFSLAVPAADNALETFLDDLDSFSADFQQVLLDSSGEALESGSGVLRLRAPGMFYWLYKEPYMQKIISDGANLWVYEEDLEQVTIRAVSAAMEDTPALIFSGDHDLNERYVVEQLENDAEHALVQLTPRNPESHYRSLRLVFSGNEPAGMVLLDTLGQTLTLTFTNTLRNPELQDEYFSFTPTAEMEVIDARPKD